MTIDYQDKIDLVDKIVKEIAQVEGIWASSSVKTPPPTDEERKAEYWRNNNYRDVLTVYVDMPSKAIPGMRATSSFCYSVREFDSVHFAEVIRGRCKMAIEDMRECERLAESSAVPP